MTCLGSASLGRRKGAPGAAQCRSRCWYNQSSAVVVNRTEQRALPGDPTHAIQTRFCRFAGFRQGFVSLGSPAAVRGGSGHVPWSESTENQSRQVRRRRRYLLTDRQCQTLGPGRYSDGGCLLLYVRPSGSRSWFVRTFVHGTRSDIGLRSVPAHFVGGSAWLRGLDPTDCSPGR